jgi:2-keto-4-pentenoate hydratase/2-oxohepta-3-ene-1,7-dioic acid hydratase in catechol pathway
MKIICVGRNYASHIEELDNEKPADPVLFMKPNTSIIPKDQPFVIPEFSKDIHYEVELLIKICKNGKFIEPQFAKNYYQEIGLGIDFTARDLQTKLKKAGLPWEKAKAFDRSACIGQRWLPVEDSDVNDTHFSLQLNGQVVQSDTTAKMLWKVDELITYISRYFTLNKGDVIFTGTLKGVGKVAENDQLKGFIQDRLMFDINVK